jgi:hypothetical protein
MRTEVRKRNNWRERKEDVRIRKEINHTREKRGFTPKDVSAELMF